MPTQGKWLDASHPETVFRVRSGRVVGKFPESLATWRVTTNSGEVAERVSYLFGGTVLENRANGEELLEVLTETDVIPVVVDGMSAVRLVYMLRGRRGIVHECDGVTFIAPNERAGKPCGCPASFDEK